MKMRTGYDIRNKITPNVVRMEYFGHLYFKTRRDRVKHEWMLNKHRLNVKVSDQYQQSN